MPDDQLDQALARFTANVREARRRAGLTQEDVAAAAGLTQGHYSLIETGKNDPGVRTLAKVAAALNTTPAELLDGVSDS